MCDFWLQSQVLGVKHRRVGGSIQASAVRWNPTGGRQVVQNLRVIYGARWKDSLSRFPSLSVQLVVLRSHHKLGR